MDPAERMMGTHECSDPLRTRWDPRRGCARTRHGRNLAQGFKPGRRGLGIGEHAAVAASGEVERRNDDDHWSRTAERSKRRRAAGV